MQKRRQSGFTLIEIMVVVVILGILAALVVPTIMSRPDQAKVTVAKTDVNAIASALEMYRLDNGFYPSMEQGLDALVKKPSGSPEPRRWSLDGYLPKVPIDPWGNPYQYDVPGTHNTRGLDVYSLGANGRVGGDGTDAEVGNWDN